jgi:threonylcarbamoyladenosine tRNA methylthiotransferase MtaB
MVGFPGETDAEFDETRRLIEDLPFTYLHVFTYSERPGTPAASDPESVPMSVRKERNRVLRDLAAAKQRAFCNSMIGRDLSSVTLNEGEIALSSNFLRVQMAAPRRPNAIVELRIGGATGTVLLEAETPPAHWPR